MSEVCSIVLAAGKGTRMRSEEAKVLHQVAGRSLVQYVVEALEQAGIHQKVIVIGYRSEAVRLALGEPPGVVYALQEEQLGTGHAVLAAQPFLQAAKTVVVTCGDTPLLTADTLQALLGAHRQSRAAATVLTCELPKPAGYGRIIRDSRGFFKAIVEERDASAEEKEIREVNTGTYCFAAGFLWPALARICPRNSQGEYYLTDVLGLLCQEGALVAAVQVSDSVEVMGINNRVDQARAEAVVRCRVNEALMLAGVTIIDPRSTFVEAGVTVGKDTILFPFTFLQGNTVVGCGCRIGPSALLADCQLGDRVGIRFSVASGCEISSGCEVGPFANLRPGTVLAEGVKIGDFVELKNSRIGTGSKIPHLTYLGDATLAEEINIGAGTITCNYDGDRKWPTTISRHAFIGSNVSLVAPVRIGEDAVVGAGSIITEDVPPKTLAIARSRQVNKADRGRK